MHIRTWAENNTAMVPLAGRKPSGYRKLTTVPQVLWQAPANNGTITYNSIESVLCYQCGTGAHGSVAQFPRLHRGSEFPWMSRRGRRLRLAASSVHQVLDNRLTAVMCGVRTLWLLSSFECSGLKRSETVTSM